MPPTPRQISFEDEPLILVDEQDRVLGYGAKVDVHRGAGRLHRAFSVFLFDAEGRLVMQQRSTQKQLWPGFWSNSCCSHPRQGETTAAAARRRVAEELGVDVTLEFVYRFIYRAEFGDHGTEHEMCSVFLGRSDQSPQANANEIAGLRPIPVDELTAELRRDPAMFTPWLAMEWAELTLHHAEVLARYTSRA